MKLQLPDYNFKELTFYKQNKTDADNSSLKGGIRRGLEKSVKDVILDFKK